MIVRFSYVSAVVAISVITAFSGCGNLSGKSSEPKMHWVSTPQYGGSEDRYLVRDDNGKVIMNIIHGSGPGATWEVCLGDGSCDGSYLTEEQAKKRAEEIATKEAILW